jgi:glycosyltransferase involved in cell wall biosynthesis
MTTVRCLTLPTRNPMGQQNYEQAITAALVDTPSRFRFEARTVGSMRSTADVRMPVGAIARSRVLERACARVLLGRTATHRFDLRIPPSAGPEVVTVHDLPPARFPDEGSLPPWAWRSLRGKAVICPSQFAADEIRELLHADDITVIPYGVRPSFRQPEPLTADELRAMGINGPFVLHAAGASLRKNLSALAAAWVEVVAAVPDVQLVLCGPEHPARTSLFAPLPRTVLAGAVPLDRVARVMAAAQVVVVPSVYEGFGLPALEAMAVGTPAVVARAGALPEVVGDASLLVEPDADGLAEGLVAVLTDAGRARALREAGLLRSEEFRWDVAAKRHIQVYERVFGRD